MPLIKLLIKEEWAKYSKGAGSVKPLFHWGFQRSDGFLLDIGRSFELSINLNGIGGILMALRISKGLKQNELDWTPKLEDFSPRKVEPA